MNVRFIRLLLIFGILISSLGLIAQNASFEDVLDIELRNMGPILENDQVKGYYLFYKVDKVDRKTNAYMLRILDENLKEVSKKKIINTKNTVLTEAVYNSNAFLFSFLDTRKRDLKLVTYDKTMKKLGTRNYELDKWGMSQYYAGGTGAGSNNEISNNNLIFPIGSEGFVKYTLQKNKRIGYTIEYLPNNLKKAGSWSEASDEKLKINLRPNFGDANEKYLVSSVMKNPKKLSNRGLTFSLQVLNMETKKIAFEKELTSKKYRYSFMNAFLNDDQQSVIVFGEYFGPKDNIYKAKSKGLYAWQMDMSGKLIKKEHHSWKGKINKMIGVNKKGQIEDGGYVAFHNIVQSADGHFYAIGEMYKKSASAAGITTAVIGGLLGGVGGVALSKMEVLDMIVFDFQSDLSLNDVAIFDKKKRNVELQAGMGMYPPTMLAHYMRAFGDFDYSYTQVKSDKTSFFTAFVSREEIEGELKGKKKSKKKKKAKLSKNKDKKKSYFGIIAHTDGDEDYVVDKIDLTTDATDISVFPAKAGYVLITEYFKKEKKINSRLEKINY